MKNAVRFPASDFQTSPWLRVATYNVHRCIGADGRYDLERIAGNIRSLDVDLVGLQEVDSGYWMGDGPDQLAILARETGMKSVAGPTLTSAPGHYGNAVLTRLPVIGVQRHDISVSRKEPRGILVVTVEVKNQSVRFLTTHLGLNYRERYEQTKKLCQIAEREQHPIIAVGDFNEWLPISPASRRLARCFKTVICPRSYPSRFPIFSLDRVYTSFGTDQIINRTDSPNVKSVASDHLPVSVSFYHKCLF